MNTIVLQPCTYISDSGINKRYINLELAIRYLKGKNKKVAIRLHVFNDNANQTITTTLNNNFKSYALEVASLCQNEGVDIFFIGCEIAESFDLYNDSYMRDIVSSIKNAYKGAVSYGATTIEVEQITWWDCCDFVGVDFYPRTTKNINADFTELLSGYYASRNNRLKLNNNQKTTPYEFLKYFYNKWNKPIYITEWDIVYGSASNHAVNGIGDSYYSGLDFGKIQAMAMDAMMTFQSECDFIVGSNIWCELIDDGADTWDDGKFRGRTNSENIVRKWGELIGY
jgi:hypothetical protein